MKVVIFSAATKHTRSGNWVTANRWRALLKAAGHQVSIIHDAAKVDRCNANVFIGIHARRSGAALLKFRKWYPNRKALLALAGTDLYGDLSPSRKRHPITAINALDACDRVILLQPLMAKRLKPDWKRKSEVVMMDVQRIEARQSARSLSSPFKICVVGHLRYEKDPFRAAMAVRETSEESPMNVSHAGKALSETFHQRAVKEESRNPNWNWVGSLPHWKVASLMKASDVLVNSSRSEGAPNVLFEAIGFRLPIIASRIDGHVGVLGQRYPGYFDVGDTNELRRLLRRCASDVRFYQRLLDASDRLAKQFKPGNEIRQLLKAIRRS